MNREIHRKTDPLFTGAIDSRAVSHGLPPDLVRKASHRLGVAALVYATVYLLAYGSSRVSTLHVLPGEMTWSHDVVAAAFIVFSLGVYFAVRGTRIPALLLLDLGLIYEVIAAAGIEIPILFWRAGVADVTQVNGISWVCVWMVFFTLIVPSTPGKTFLAAMGAASMRPFAYLLLAAQGSELPAGPVLFQLIFPNYISVGIAVFASRIIYGLGTDVSRARQMGSYRLVDRLGQGGMGEVWRAEHHLLARPAAVKLIRPEALGDSGEEKQQIIRRF